MHSVYKSSEHWQGREGNTSRPMPFGNLHLEITTMASSVPMVTAIQPEELFALASTLMFMFAGCLALIGLSCFIGFNR